MSDNRPAVYDIGDFTIIRASALGYCTTYFHRVYQGQVPEPPPENVQTAMDFGTEHETAVLRELQDNHGWALWDEARMRGHELEVHKGQAMLDLPVAPKTFVRMHLDGIATRYKKLEGDEDATLGEHAVVEVKCMAPGASLERYNWQISAQMHAARRTRGITKLLLVVGWKNDDRDGIERVEVRELATPPYTTREMRKRGREIMHAIRADDPPACDVKMWPCGFWRFHDGTGVWAEPEHDEYEGGDGDELERLVNLWRNAKEKEAAAGREARTWGDDRKKYGEQIAELIGWGKEVSFGDHLLITTETEVPPKQTKGYTMRKVEVKERKTT